MYHQIMPVFSHAQSFFYLSFSVQFILLHVLKFLVLKKLRDLKSSRLLFIFSVYFLKKNFISFLLC